MYSGEEWKKGLQIDELEGRWSLSYLLASFRGFANVAFLSLTHATKT